MAPNMDILCEITNNKAAEDLKKKKKKALELKERVGPERNGLGIWD